ncbi:pyocin knob domain-containing protein [Pantoea septica]|uniref:pyocin knob domain-containing protein n=1 Tax=Pantoea septica TaxID=472695 RepID=UPI00289FE169|nr:pyocin knob domain-containing protein [Pantoea septica]
MTQFLYPYFTPGAAGYRDGLIWFRGFNGGTWGSWVSVWSTNRTTVDANGFIKSASPILRLTNAPEVMDDSFTDGFTLSGVCAVNYEAEGARAEKVGIGQYRIIGAKGLAKEGWTIEMPQDINKNPLCFVEVNETDSGAIMVNVYKRKFDVDTAMVIAGEQMDIPDGRWIDLRLDMPETSAQATIGVESN